MPHTLGVFLEFRVTLGNVMQVLRLGTVCGKQRPVQTSYSRGTTGRISRQPSLDRRARVSPPLCVPVLQRRQAPPHRCHVERLVRTRLGNPAFVSIGGNAQQAVNARLHRWLPASATLPQVHVPGAAHQPAAHGVGAFATTHLGDCFDHRRRSSGQEVGQDFAAQQVAFAVFHRPCAGQHASFAREGSEQILRECVNRVDPQPPARTIEYAGKQGARACARVGIGGCAEIGEFTPQLRLVHAHPSGEHCIDPHCHFGRARLGKGQAQHLRRVRARFEQQSQHPCGEYLRLAGARAGR